MYKNLNNVFKYLSPEACASTFPSGSEIGRSMIEMLGVLAIIGVLSVGGIAGYGKAMRMWNSNQQKEQLTQLLHSLIRLRYDLGHDRKYAEQQANVAAILYALDGIPVEMRYNGNLLDKNGFSISSDIRRFVRQYCKCD